MLMVSEPALQAGLCRRASLSGQLICPHNLGAVDLDIYGAFQLCAIGILAAPVTARISSTYFNDPGRNTIFLWTMLLLAG